ALLFEGESLTYAELNSRANRLARRLRAAGVGPDVPVAVAMERSTELVISLLAVLKAGGAYLPLEPTDPRERLRLMLEDAASPLLLTQERWRLAVERPGLTLLTVPPGGRGFEEQEDSNLDASVQPDNLAYVIFTSGSTGRPKGVMSTHRGIVNRLAWMQECYALAAEDRVLQKT